jgi:cyanophycinase-like exopeptidase
VAFLKKQVSHLLFFIVAVKGLAYLPIETKPAKTMKHQIVFLLGLALISSSCQKQIAVDASIQREPGMQAKAQPSVVTYLTGSAADVTPTPTAGMLLMGGSTDVDAAVKWFLDRANGGDVVVIRSTGADGYNQYMYDLSTVNSVETIIIDTRTKASDASVASKIRNAEALFIAGGDQWDYVNYWKNTAVEDAINYLLNTKKAPVGGTSAGLAVLGSTYFSAMSGTVTSDKALADPYNRYMTLGNNDFISAPFLANTITDSHYTQRDRQGRHIAFMARMMKDYGFNLVKGIGVDEQTAVCTDGTGKCIVFGLNNAYFLRNTGAGPETCVARQKLTWVRSQQAVSAYIIPGSATGNGQFDLNNFTGSGGTSRFYYVNNGVLY